MVTVDPERGTGMGLSVAFDDITALRERCQVAHLRVVNGRYAYEEGAVVPSRAWESITEPTGNSVKALPQTPDSALVEIVKPPRRVKLLRNMVDHLGDTDAVHLGQAYAPAGALTTTVNNANGLRIGLHVDNWDRLPYGTRHTGRRRLCLNLGPGTRYLLLGDTDIQQVCRAVHEHYGERYPHTDDIRRYVAAERPMRCFRIRLDPGEGYVVPTELLPHDGSTEDQPEQSTAAFWLGNWQRGVLPSLV
ncbi:hypothetical protein [Streptomyces sp. NPDC021212]|uniref:hypothetical protein n=1 Tax=Streptomyces sp. NPDC021212 TaxID=3365118 RepID=UPI003791F00D